MADRTLARRDRDDIEPFEAMDRADDEQIIADIQGYNPAVMSRLVYRFKPRGSANYITGLSKAGVLETVRQMNMRGLTEISVSDTPLKIVETGDYFHVEAYARDTLHKSGYWGVKRQPKAGNPFALEQAVAKAQRNALFALIPAAYVTEMIDTFLQKSGNAVHTIEATRKPTQIAAPSAPQITRADWADFKLWYESEGLTIDNVLALLGVPDRKALIAAYRDKQILDVKDDVLEAMIGGEETGAGAKDAAEDEWGEPEREPSEPVESDADPFGDEPADG